MQNSKFKPSISIFFPFLNDWGTIGSLIGLAISTVEKLTDDWEIIIVNDGSEKESREALEMIMRVINKEPRTKNQAFVPRTFDRAQSRASGRGEPRTKYQKAIKTPRMVARRDSSEVEELAKIRIVRHQKNRGYGGALRSGFSAATKDLVFYTDGDAQYDPRELTRLYEEMKPAFSASNAATGDKPAFSRLNRDSAGKVGMVNGYKIKRSDPWYRTVAGRIYHYLVKFAFGLPIRDTDCDFRLIRREVFKRVKLFENTGTICCELVKKIDHFGYKIVEVPVHHYWRTSGKSQFFNFGRLFKTATNLLRLWWKLIVMKEYYK